MGLPELRTFARLLRHTGSFRASCVLASHRRGLAEFRLPGWPGSFRVRTGTSDAALFRYLALNMTPTEYAVPEGETPKVILDIGANVGVASLMFAKRFPAARIFAFEPLPENLELLRYNTRKFPQVRAIPYALGAITELRKFFYSDDPGNFGGGGFVFQRNVPTLELPMLAVLEAFERYEIPPVDLIKIDVEGAEGEILGSFPNRLIESVRTIVGELHQAEPQLLGKLRGAGFDLALTPVGAGSLCSYLRATRSTPSRPAHSRALAEVSADATT